MKQNHIITRKSTQVHVLPGLQENILKALATYKYLTVSQFLMLKIGIRNRVYEAIRTLYEYGFVKYAEYGSYIRNHGKAERIHYLTPKGAKFLVDHTPNLHFDDIRYPKSTTLFTHDYHHRVSSINTQISVMKWIKQANFELVRYANYFDVTGSRRTHKTNPSHAITRIEFGNDFFLDPDGILIYENHEQKPKIILIETYNGHDTKRTVGQLRKHSYAVKHGLAAKKYDIHAPTRVCSTFETKEAMKSVIDRLKDDEYFQFKNIELYFYFALADDVINDFDTAFIDLSGTRRRMTDLSVIT